VGYNLSVDGGGTKLAGILFDDRLNALGRGLGQAINYASKDDIEQAIDACIDGCLGGRGDLELDHVYVSMPASFELFVDRLKRKARVSRIVFLNEGAQCLLAGRQTRRGIVALSGTGAGVFRIDDDDWRHMGGWGHLLGDHGSAYCIGRDAIGAALLAMEGRGPETALNELFAAEWNVRERHDMFDAVYLAPKPRSKVASAALLAARAAQMGDEVAVGIFERAGADMAVQAIAMLEQHGQGGAIDVMVAGSGWKGCKRMFDVFRESVMERFPRANVCLPKFEPVMGGAFLRLLELGDVPDGQLFERLERDFEPFVYVTQWTNS